MKYVVLPCLFENDKTKSSKLFGKESLLKDYTIRNIIFFNFDALEPAFEEESNTNYTILHLSNTDFATLLTIEEVLDEIQKAFSITNVTLKAN